jgi:hypothetical protein
LGIEVLAQLEEADVQRLLFGWQDHGPDPAGFDWVKQRLAEEKLV